MRARAIAQSLARNPWRRPAASSRLLAGPARLAAILRARRVLCFPVFSSGAATHHVGAQTCCALPTTGIWAQQACAPTGARARRIVAVCAAFGLVVLAHADSWLTDDPTQLPPLEIAAARLATDDVTLRPYAVTRTALSGRAIATLKDALGQAPGVLLQESFGGFEPPRLSLRGSGLQSAPSSRGVQFLLDDLPLTLADGSFNSALIDLQLVERVTVLRGEAAAVSAPAALGGAINLRSPGTGVLPVDSERGTGILPVIPTRTKDILPVDSVRLEFGSFGAVRGALTASGRTARSALTAAGTFSRMDGYRDHSAQQRTGLLTKISLRGDATPSSRLPSETSLSLYHVGADYDVPGPLTLTAAALAPRSVSADVQRDLPRREAELTRLALETTWLTPDLFAEAGAAWLHSDDWFRQLRPLGLSDSRSDDLTLRAAVTRPLAGSHGNPVLRVGTTLTRGWRTLTRHRNDSGTTGPQFGHNALSATTAAIDASASVRLRADLTATVGLGGLASERKVSDRLAGASAASTARSQHASGWQPRAQLHWTPRRELTFFAAAARAVEPPTFDDLLVVAGTYPNLVQRSQPLVAQRATTLEAGTSGARGRFGWDVTAYEGRWTNEILRLADAQGLPRGAVNAGPTRHAGLETALHWQILDGEHPLRLTTAATWSRFTFADDPLFGRNRLAGAPPHVGTARLLYAHPRGFFAGASVDWTAGATPVDHANRMHYGGHALTHVRLGWRHASRPAAPTECHLIGDIRPRTGRGFARAGWTVFVEVKNLFDRAHIASTAGVLDLVRNPAATTVFLPGPGRAFTVGFEWSR